MGDNWCGPAHNPPWSQVHQKQPWSALLAVLLGKLKGTRRTPTSDHTIIEEPNNSRSFAETPIFDQIINLGQNKNLRLRLVGRDHIDHDAKIKALQRPTDWACERSGPPAPADKLLMTWILVFGCSSNKICSYLCTVAATWKGSSDGYNNDIFSPFKDFI